LQTPVIYVSYISDADFLRSREAPREGQDPAPQV
jgi:hypothetical protein